MKAHGRSLRRRLDFIWRSPYDFYDTCFCRVTPIDARRSLQPTTHTHQGGLCDVVSHG